MAEKEYIDREALLVAFDRTISELRVKAGENVLLQTSIGFIQNSRDFVANFPAADVVEVRHGEWERIVDGGIGNCFGYCSICKAIHKADNPSELKYVYRHCRWCGAKMDGKGEG